MNVPSIVTLELEHPIGPLTLVNTDASAGANSTPPSPEAREPAIEATSAIQSGAQSAGAALKRCCTAWRRAFNASIKELGGDPRRTADFYLASTAAAPAFCHAMPILVGPDGIRDFVACVSHGMLIGAIPLEMGNQLLYAAHVAVSAANGDKSLPKLPPTVKRKRR